ncbi:MAG: NAD-dependent DNA ligase LigA [Lachnospiraceae bacterium]|nr:NAD-dependent DNA ligase LigA [Lachnospiraceae bacterium]
MDDMKRMKELVEVLNRASEVYYQGDSEIMSNFEYDSLYDELKELESRTNTVLSDSPTIRVGYEVLSSLPKVRHDSPMLSLDKTKDPEALRAWLGDKTGDLSWKMDGLTIVLTYEHGVLVQAATRGNGEVGEIITNNAMVFRNVPHKVNFPGRLVIRGEAVISYEDFEKINAAIPDGESKYKNPRNLCSGSVRQLDNRITKSRSVYFIAFALVEAEGFDDGNSRIGRLRFLDQLGFDTVETKQVDKDNILDTIKWFFDSISDNRFPSDGLVLCFDDMEYSGSLGQTSKFPRDSIAFKWKDETAETRLLNVEWNASRTGLINPVAIFEPVDLEGTEVSRASVHNVSIIENLKLGIGDIIRVYKANMIIPQIAEDVTASGTLPIPDKCPVCGGEAVISEENGTKTLICINPDCPAKMIKSFEHFVERNCMNIEGLSIQTLEKFVDMGMVREFADIYDLSDHKDRIVSMEGFGEKSYAKLTASIEKSRDVTPWNFINSLGIPNVGLSNAKLLCGHFDNDPEKIAAAGVEEMTDIEGVGPVIGESVSRYFADEKTRGVFERLLEKVNIIKPEKGPESAAISGKTFVITGSLNTFVNRDELKEVIERNGGKVTGSVSNRTDYLINNDVNSNSGKNKKARELGIPVISEEDFRKML